MVRRHRNDEVDPQQEVIDWTQQQQQQHGITGDCTSVTVDRIKVESRRSDRPVPGSIANLSVPSSKSSFLAAAETV